MKKIFTLICFLFTGLAGFANNIVISNISLSKIDATSAYIQFDLSWDNSWRISTGPNNWDAAWVFFKWSTTGPGGYSHALLSSTSADHVTTGNAQIDAVSDGMGVFVYRNANGFGTNTWTGLKVKWTHTTDVPDVGVDCINIQGFALEMVKVPTGSFYLGDGTTTNVAGQFRNGSTNTPLQVTSASSITTLGGVANGNLANNNTTGMLASDLDDFNNSTTKALPASFPNGYNGFYCMKTELQQSEYAAFLNNLTSAQAAARVFLMAGVYRCAIYGSWPNFTGPYVAVNYVAWSDMAAYLDWAGLRPMTELEFEKACRGPQVPIADEYAWGTTVITQATGIVNDGAYNEIVTPAGANCNFGSAALVGAPLRVGCFAAMSVNHTRQETGASYYGIMELSGNLWEKTISVGNASGRAYTGLTGDGTLDAAGAANVSNWPGSSASGVNLRGGTCVTAAKYVRVSDRYYGSYITATRVPDYGLRGIR